MNRNVRAVEVPHIGDIKNPGQFAFTGIGGLAGGPYGMVFSCPCGCGVESSIAFDNRPAEWISKTPERLAWHWDGNRENPTLSPSLHKPSDCLLGSDLGTMQPHPGWHGFLRAGIFQEC